ncbi:MAG TPA: fibronectin type III domain-containing protein [Acidobacteriaceae bacterium]
MNRPYIKLAAIVAAYCLALVLKGVAQLSPSTERAAKVRITEGPAVELNRDNLTMIRWVVNNPGGSPVHYGIVHYGTDPNRLNQVAKSPIRLNPNHPNTVFRVRIYDLRPGTTYYYTVQSAEANGTDDRVKSGIDHFTIAGSLGP